MLIKSNNITCPKCNTSLKVINHNSVVFVCSQCQNIFYKDKDLNIHFRFQPERKNLCETLDIGDNIRYNGLEYTLTGKLVKYERDNKLSLWTEYCFANDTNETIFLTESGGHWNMVEQADDLLDKLSGDIEYTVYYEGPAYERFNKYIIELAYAEGEFDADAFDDIGNTAIEFVKAPTTIILQTSKKREKHFFIGHYYFQAEVEKLLNRKLANKYRIGIGGAQPFYFNLDSKSVINAGILLIILFSILQIVISSLYPKVDILKNQSLYMTPVETPSQAVILVDNINVPYDHCLMNISIECSSLSNDWVGADFALVNDNTNDIQYFSIEAAKYSGYDDEGSWSSGDNDNNGNVQNLEKGKYHLEITPVNGTPSTYKVITVSLTVYKGSWYVFWFFAGVVILALILYAYLQQQFENKKWDQE